jgi:hypothetical protein
MPDGDGKVIFTYTSCEVSGTETIEAIIDLMKLVDGVATTSGHLLTKEAIIAVAVKDGEHPFIALPNDRNEPCPPNETRSSAFGYRLVGKTNEHACNHFGSVDTILRTIRIAVLYLEGTGNSLRINDMSLFQGGLFDVKGKWSAVGGHFYHRKGMSVDISLSDVNQQGGFGATDRVRLREIIKKDEVRGCLYPETTIHVDFDTVTFSIDEDNDCVPR